MARILLSETGEFIDYGEPESTWSPARTERVFDDLIIGTAAQYTSIAWNDWLASGARYRIHAVADQVTGTSPTLTVQFEHSADERAFVVKNPIPEMNAIALTVGGTTSTISALTSGARAEHRTGRLRVQLGGTSPVAHVKIWVTVRPLA